MLAMNNSSYLFTELKKIMSGMIIKYQSRADKYELSDIDYAREVDDYISAVEGTDEFAVHRKYSSKAIILSGLTENEQLAEIYSRDTETIPVEWRERVHKAQRRVTIDSYVERNQYYRALAGQPPIDMDPLNYAYGWEGFYEEYNLPFVPVHELDDHYVDIMMASPDWKDLLSMYNPYRVEAYRYLQHLGSQRVDYYTSRQATNFDVLNIGDNNVEPKVLEDFISYYSQNRQYMLTVLFKTDYAYKYPYYEEYMAMMLTVMTIQRVIVNQFKNGIEREFYDMRTLKMLFDCYNIPFLEEVPINYQRAIAKNLNKLLMYKSSDKVIYDISSLLGFDQLTVHKYMLVKQHRYDNDGLPEFFYTTNELGEKVLDYERMYDVYFMSMDIKERDVGASMRKQSNRVSYDSVVDSDAQWWKDDPELRKRLYETDYNYIETKYLHMNVMYKLTEMLFQTSTFIRMVMDNPKYTMKINTSLPKLTLSGNISYYDAIITLSTIMCYRNGLKGNFIYGPTKTLAVLGFNFKERLNILKTYSSRLPKRMRTDIDKLIGRMNVASKEDINRTLGNIEDFRKYLTDHMRYTNDIEVYRVLKDLYDALLVTEINEETYLLKDGTPATTIQELLLDRRPDIHERIFAIDPKEESELLKELSEHIIYRLQDELDRLTYMYYLEPDSNVMVDALRTLIRFFKSYTVDLREFNVLYMIDSKYHNMIKLIDYMRGTDIEALMTDETLRYQYKDILSTYLTADAFEDLRIEEKGTFITYLMVHLDIINRMDINSATIDATITMELGEYQDNVKDVKTGIPYRDKLMIDERFSMTYQHVMNEFVRIINQIYQTRVAVHVEHETTAYNDIINSLVKRAILRGTINLDTTHRYDAVYNLSNNCNLTHKVIADYVSRVQHLLKITSVMNNQTISELPKDVVGLQDTFNKQEYRSYIEDISTTITEAVGASMVLHLGADVKSLDELINLTTIQLEDVTKQTDNVFDSELTGTISTVNNTTHNGKKRSRLGASEIHRLREKIWIVRN